MRSLRWTFLRELKLSKMRHFRRLYSASPDQCRNSPIEKILIANRGEIACRIMRTANRLGIRTVAVYSVADADSLHVNSADEAIRIGPPPARLSYLNTASIVDAAIKTGCQAIHPGYGFLSESPDFAQICEDNGIIFIGPPVSAIRDMGNKSASKKIMLAAGVPLVPGYHGDEQDVELMKSHADKIGYPVLIKPTHGGGGKGMRIVHGPGKFIECFLAAQREAAASFGVDTILLEKYITRPRHIEVQIFGDKYGNIIHLNERDCSIQRRHQKIIEEAPAPNITLDFRSHLGQTAISAAKAVGYYSAGTVEFIVDTLSKEFYFMEMNTRLQVEHPVTEMIVGHDLVEWQIRVANGEPLQLKQSHVSVSGHAFEARIYAEDIAKGFLPSSGVLHHYRPVPVSSTVRLETGVAEADTVSFHYDPMIAKLVVWGENRASALVKLRDCLSRFQVAGLPTNIAFLQRLASHFAFRNGMVETNFIEQFKDDLFADFRNTSKLCDVVRISAILAAACICKQECGVMKKSSCGLASLLSVWYSQHAFRVHHSATRSMELVWSSECNSDSLKRVKLSITYLSHGGFIIETGEDNLEVDVAFLGGRDFQVKADGSTFNVTMTTYFKDEVKHVHIWHGSYCHHFSQRIEKYFPEVDDDNNKADFEAVPFFSGKVTTPMAGLVVKVLVKDGAKVHEGQSVLVLEAMKMEHVVEAPSSGYICGLSVMAGQQVSDGSVLFSMKALVEEREGGTTA